MGAKTKGWICVAEILRPRTWCEFGVKTRGGCGGIITFDELGGVFAFHESFVTDFSVDDDPALCRFSLALRRTELRMADSTFSTGFILGTSGRCVKFDDCGNKWIFDQTSPRELLALCHITEYVRSPNGGKIQWHQCSCVIH